VTDVAKESTARILTAAAAARNSNYDSQKILEELEAPIILEGQSSRLFPPTPPAAGGNINPKTTSIVNIKDMKSPSVEDT
jgi:hypothetical protein